MEKESVIKEEITRFERELDLEGRKLLLNDSSVEQGDGDGDDRLMLCVRVILIYDMRRVGPCCFFEKSDPYYTFKYLGDPDKKDSLKTPGPSREDVQSMLLDFALANQDYWHNVRENPPVIILEDLLSGWFVQPNSPELSDKLLKSLLSVFGKIRFINVAKSMHNGDYCLVMVHYENIIDFYAALKTLCVCSVHKGSNEMVDFDVALRTDECFTVSLCPSKRKMRSSRD